MEITGEEYAKLLQSASSLDKEINPICMTIEDMITRLDELESLLANVKGESNIIIDQYASNILSFTSSFGGLKEHVDKLEEFVEIVDNNVNEVEKSLDLAESELHVTDYSFKGLLFKAISGTPTNTEETAVTPTSDIYGKFRPIPIFETNIFFGNDANSTDGNQDAKHIQNN